MPSEAKRLLLLSPRGFCAGVCRAVDAVEKLCAVENAVYLLHELVHNECVSASLHQCGASVVDSPLDVPVGGVIVYSAHGVSNAVEMASRARSLRVMDATCPLVKEVHRRLLQLLDEGVFTILIGHLGHSEVQGTLGRTSNPVPVIAMADKVATLPMCDGRVAVLTQTTLSDEEIEPVLSALKQRYPQLEMAGGICYATRNRQHAVRALDDACDTVIVVGSAGSSNSRRLQEVAAACGKRSFLILSADALTAEMLADARVIALTSGASTPESSVTAVVEKLRALGWPAPEDIGKPESVLFPAPRLVPSEKS